MIKLFINIVKLLMNKFSKKEKINVINININSDTKSTNYIYIFFDDYVNIIYIILYIKFLIFN